LPTIAPTADLTSLSAIWVLPSFPANDSCHSALDAESRSLFTLDSCFRRNDRNQHGYSKTLLLGERRQEIILVTLLLDN